MTNHYTDVCEATIESMRQQLAAAIAACKLKDEALEQLLDDMGEEGHWVYEATKQLAKEALAATKPDDSALKEWLGEPEWFYRKNADGVNVFYEDIEERPHGCKPLYSPKGLK